MIIGRLGVLLLLSHGVAGTGGPLGSHRWAEKRVGGPCCTRSSLDLFLSFSQSFPCLPIVCVFLAYLPESAVAPRDALNCSTAVY